MDIENNKDKADEIDDAGDILIEEHIKIFDPNTDQEYVNKRGGN